MLDVLLVDTEPLIRQLVADMLEEAGLRVIAAVAGIAEAQKVLARYSLPTVMVLVIGVRPPIGRCGLDLNGKAVATELRRRLEQSDDQTRPHSFGVVYIGEHIAALGGDALGPGERFLSEPFGSAALVQAAFAVIEREMPGWLASRMRDRAVLRT